MTPASAVDDVLGLLQRQCGLTFPAHRLGEVRDAVGRAADASAPGAPGRFAEHLRRNADALGALLDDLTVGETYFFRHPDQFDLIRDVILPEITARRGADHTVRVWSAGCSSGEEAYSLAMALKHAGLAARSRVVATDISPRSLAKARAAEYGEWSLRDQGRRALPDLNVRGKRYAVADDIRAAVDFRLLNLASQDYPSAGAGLWEVDLILCRNVMLYLAPAATAEVVWRLWATLADGGWLLVGPADPSPAQWADFDVVPTPAGPAYRRPGAVPRTPAVPVLQHEPQPQHEPRPAAHPRPEPAAEEVPIAPPRTTDDDAPRLPPVPPAGGDTGEADDVRRIRALADSGQTGRAEAELAAARSVGGARADLERLHALLMMAAGRWAEGVRSARRALYLDRRSAEGHFVMGLLLERLGRRPQAARAFRNAVELCRSDGGDAGLARAAGARLALLQREGPPR